MSTNRRRRRRWSPEEKAEILRQCEESGLSKTQFAESLGIAPSVLERWRQKRLPAPVRTADQRLVPVQVRDEPGDSSPALELVLSEGRSIRVPRGFDADALTRLVEVLERC